MWNHQSQCMVYWSTCGKQYLIHCGKKHQRRSVHYGKTNNRIKHHVHSCQVTNHHSIEASHCFKMTSMEEHGAIANVLAEKEKTPFEKSLKVAHWPDDNAKQLKGIMNLRGNASWDCSVTVIESTSSTQAVAQCQHLQPSLLMDRVTLSRLRRTLKDHLIRELLLAVQLYCCSLFQCKLLPLWFVNCWPLYWQLISENHKGPCSPTMC